MYQRFRIWVDSDMAEELGKRPLNVPPSPPESANLDKAGAPQVPDSQRNGPEPGRGEEFGTELQGVYIISVAARILDMHPQTLRKYERLGLINPGRTVGMLRLYSREDIRKVFLIRHLMENLGLNLAGVKMAMQLFNRMIKMRSQMAQLEGQPLREALNESLDEMFKILAG